MDPMLLTMRLLHVALGVFWAGTLIFNALFLQPSIRDAGPEGGKVVVGLLNRHFMNIMPVVALVTILSGIWLYWRVSGGFKAWYMRSAVGMTYGLGAAAALVAFVIGVGVLRPAMLRAVALSQAVAQAGTGASDERMATAQALRARAATAGRIVAALLALAVVAMAVGRYV